VSKVPLHLFGCGVTIELVADVDEVLYGSDIHIVDRREVENDSLEGGQVIFDDGSLPRTITRSAICVGISAASLLENRGHHVVQVVIGVGVVVSFRESVDEDSRVRRVGIDHWVGTIIVLNGQKDAAICLFVIVRVAVWLVFVLEKMITDDRVDLNLSEETTTSLDNTEEEKSDRHTNSSVDTVLNRGEDGDEDTGEEDENLDRRNLPELVNSVGGSDKIADGMDNDGREDGVGNVEEYCWQGVNGQQNDDSGNDTSKRCANNPVTG
jgi:hypothetical protein